MCLYPPEKTTLTAIFLKVSKFVLYDQLTVEVIRNCNIPIFAKKMISTRTAF